MKKNKYSYLFIILASAFIFSGCDENSSGVAKLGENEVGIMLNNLSGEMSIVTDVGTQVFFPALFSFYTIDKREQTMEMTANPNTGARFSKDDLKIKTLDGSDVYVDLTIQYKIIPSMVDTIIIDSGPGDAYKYKWIRDYSRSISRLEFGELTTEEFYNSTKRTQKAIEVKDTLNKMLTPHGLKITNIIPQDFRFYAEYEKKIKEKKSADQEVDKQKSKAQAATENQKREIIDIERLITIKLTEFKGQQKQRIVQTTGESKKAHLNADAYYYKTVVGADAGFYKMKQSAEAILAVKTADAEGMKKHAEALEGKGGQNIVLREYVKKLQEVEISAKPYLFDNQIKKIHVNRDSETAATDSVQ